MTDEDLRVIEGRWANSLQSSPPQMPFMEHDVPVLFAEVRRLRGLHSAVRDGEIRVWAEAVGGGEHVSCSWLLSAYGLDPGAALGAVRGAIESNALPIAEQVIREAAEQEK